MKKMLLIDGFSIFFRSFYATAKYAGDGHWIVMHTENGQATNAVRVFCNLIINLLETRNPDKVAVVFDSPTKSWRHDHDFYKATRKDQPTELKTQIPLVKEFLKLYGIPMIELPNLEADDVIGILAKKEKENYEVEIVTGDKDFLQLVDKNIVVDITRKGITDVDTYDVEKVIETYEGLTPHQLIDLKGLMGDSSDNLPGVKGVGPKTAIKLIKEYGTIENVYENIENIKGTLKEKLIKDKEQAFLSRDLGRIMIDSPIEEDASHLSMENFDANKLKSWLMDLELFSIMNKLNI